MEITNQILFENKNSPVLNVENHWPKKKKKAKVLGMTIKAPPVSAPMVLP